MAVTYLCQMLQTPPLLLWKSPLEVALNMRLAIHKLHPVHILLPLIKPIMLDLIIVQLIFNYTKLITPQSLGEATNILPLIIPLSNNTQHTHNPPLLITLPTWKLRGKK